MNSIDRKLRRSAAALKNGGKILAWLYEPEQCRALIKAADDGLPSVAGISRTFLEKFGDEAAGSVIIRQFVGRVVKFIMADAGYDPADGGVKLPNDPVFSSGTRYVARSEEKICTEGDDSLLKRFVAMLSPVELRQLQRLAAEQSSFAGTDNWPSSPILG